MLRWIGYVAHMGNENVSTTFARKSEGRIIIENTQTVMGELY
jgi:hypothetical protein